MSGRTLIQPGAGRTLARGLLALALAGLALVAPACQQPATPTGGAQIGVTIDEILADPPRFIGQTVATTAGVGQVISERVIVLQSQTPGKEMLAVLSDQALRSVGAIQPGESLHVVGTVAPLTREEIRQVEQQLRITLDEEQLLSLAGQAPFVVVRDARR